MEFRERPAWLKEGLFGFIFLMLVVGIVSADIYDTIKDYDKLAKENPNNHLICENAIDSYDRDICIQSFALETRNSDLCSLMEDKKFKTSCYKYTSFKLNSYWIKVILLSILGITVVFLMYLFLILRIKKTKENWSYIKIGATAGGILGVPLAIVGQGTLDMNNLTRALFKPAIYFMNLSKCSGEDCWGTVIILGFIEVLIVGIIVGILIGWIVGKIKNRNTSQLIKPSEQQQ